MIRIEALTTDFSATHLSHIRIFASAEDIAMLPKSARIGRHGQAYIEFRSNGSNGGTNETGAKRIKAILKAADKHGLGVVFNQPAHIKDALNAPLWGKGMRTVTRAELESLINA